MVLPGNLYMMLLGQLWLPGSCCPGVVGIRLPSWEGPDPICHQKSPALWLSASQFPWCLFPCWCSWN